MPYTPVSNSTICYPDAKSCEEENSLEVAELPVCLHVTVGREYIQTGPNSAVSWKPSKKELEEVRAEFEQVKNIPVVVTHIGVHVNLIKAAGVQYGRR